MTVSEVTDITGPGMSRGTEVIRGDGGDFAVVPAGLEPGEVTFDINYTGTATQVALRDATANDGALSFRVVSPAATAAFRGYVTGFEFSAPVSGILRASVTVTLASTVAYS